MKYSDTNEAPNSARGKKSWYFPDAEIPPAGDDPELFGHESLIILNPNEKDAKIAITLYFTDRDPVVLPETTVEAGRVRCIRATESSGFLGMKLVQGEQYAMGVESDNPVIAQYGRLDVRRGGMAFYTTPGYCE